MKEAVMTHRRPRREPIRLRGQDALADCVFTSNITHNLRRMADAAGIYQYLWRPEELGITQAKQLIEPLTHGLDLLRSMPKRFQQLNPPNGWGNYEGLCEFVASYLAACKEHPNATVAVKWLGNSLQMSIWHG